MSNRSLTILACVAVALVIVTVVLYSNRGGRNVGFVGGSLLIQGLDPAQIATIVVTKGDTTVTLNRRSEGFVLMEKHDYPASAKEINDLLIDCLDIRCAAKVTDDPGNHTELGVAEGSPAAVFVTFSDSEGKKLTGIVKGGSLQRGPGVYLRLADSDTVYASDGFLSISTNAIDYTDKDLATVPKEDIQRVVVTGPEGTYVIARDDDDNIVLEGVPEGKRPKGTDYEDVFNALARLQLSDVMPTDSLDVERNVFYECTMKGGLVYRAELAEKDDKTYVTLSAQAPIVGRVEVSPTESDEELKKKDDLLMAATTAKKFADRHGGWAYEISSWTSKNLRKPFADLIEDVPAEDTPDSSSE